ncbi:Glycosyltransferase WbsX [Actinacidiphila yanglinensis]|uniref:Glycosyltransferase WbsX n=1 Tax=Actinacidiphila yanglinensis TaxID=310779 RepID=A0A1H6D9J0_9ACTN|nr:glycoside hydrolase family 99-like domain-containing protein [Actinacidiphila yanglinensis]SEG81940.1 Glycosyltransferase WbsX [Actinacidiphila yanglinensis]
MTVPTQGGAAGFGAAAGPDRPLGTGSGAAGRDGRPPQEPGPATVLAYYYPQWHVDEVNVRMHGAGWTEWPLVRGARPRFAGHVQPKQPLWGAADEASPAVAGRAVGAALDHGIDGFLVDWYWYDNRPFLNGALDGGLLRAERMPEFRFALMWANHDWNDLYPARSVRPATLLPAPNTRYHARCAFRHVIERYLTHPSYWRIGGAAYFSIYDVPAFTAGMGGPAAAADVLAGFRAAAAAAGVGELHLNGVTTFQIDDPGAMATRLGFDSVTHYTWWHHPDAGFDSFPTTDYRRVHDRARQVWREFDGSLPVPYLPNVTVGWDPSPRTTDWDMRGEDGYPYTSLLAGNSPEAVGAALRDALDLVAARTEHRVVTVNAWNEWSEGSFLEPERQYGFGYLEAVRAAVRGAAGARRGGTA